MKTLIISGTVSKSKISDNMLTYDLCLFGQTKEMPLMQVIKYEAMECSGYNDMQEKARAAYAKYFNTDLFNIISLENIHIIS